MLNRNFHTWFSIAAALTVLALIAAACASVTPSEPSREPASEEPVATAPAAPTPGPTPLPAIPESRLLVLEWPAAIRTGDSRIIRLNLVIDEEGRITPTAEVEGQEIRGETVEIPNLYDTHNVLVEARLDMAGVQVVPDSEVNEPMRPGKGVTFFWSVNPQNVGTYQGVIWLHLRFVPLAGGPEIRSLLSAQTIEIQAVNLFGMGGTPARVVGAVGALVGSVLGLDNVLPWIWKRVKKKDKPHPAS